MAQTGFLPIQLYYSTTASAAPSAGNLANGEVGLNITDGKLYYKDNTGTVKLLAANLLPIANGGTNSTASPAAGTVAYGTGTAYAFTTAGSAGQYLQSNGTSAPSWVSAVGGAGVSNDTATATYEYPLFASVTTGTPTTIYTSNSKYLYKPSTGELLASAMISNNGISLNNATVSVDYTIPAGYNASSAGPVTVASGVTVTVASGSTWVIV
jgi:hypothetical protein